MSDFSEQAEHSHLGYLYHYPKINGPTPFQLDICISNQPSEHYFVPKIVSVSAVSNDQENLIEHMKIEHPMGSTRDRRICPGVVRMVDRNNVVEEALTFGGSLAIETTEDATFLILTSTAPIIKITHTTKMDEFLRDEIEILWAERRAHWLAEPGEFERRLVSADPLVLYRASLNALIEKYTQLRHHDPQGGAVLHHIQTLIARLDKAGYRMMPEPSLTKVL